MEKNKDLLPENFESLDDFWSFWDSHSLADYQEYLQPIEFDIDLIRNRR